MVSVFFEESSATCRMRAMIGQVDILRTQSSILVPNLLHAENPFHKSSATARCLYKTTLLAVCLFAYIGENTRFLNFLSINFIWQTRYDNYDPAGLFQ